MIAARTASGSTSHTTARHDTLDRVDRDSVDEIGRLLVALGHLAAAGP